MRPGYLIAACFSGLVGCQGLIGDAPATPPPGNDASDAPFALTCGDRGVIGTREPAIRRMSRPELIASLRQLLGDDVYNAIADTTARLPDDPRDPTAFPLAYDSSHVDAMVDIAARAAFRIVDDAATRTRMAGTCATSASPPKACARAFIASFAEKAFRRPVAAADIDALLADYDATDADIRFMNAIARVLTSPHMLFVIEEGRAAEGARVRLSSHEVASRIAFAVTHGPPDAELLEAAARDGLQSVEAVRDQVRRLLGTEPARAVLREIFDGWLHIGQTRWSLLSAQRRGLDAQTLKAQVDAEAMAFVEHILWDENGSMRDLFTANLVFPRTDDLATIYGVAKADKAVAPKEARPGVLLHAALLGSGADFTSPIMRGANLLKNVLCADLASPDASIISERSKEVANVTRADYSTREMTDLLTSAPQCTGCHSIINPYGFALESFDELGMWRDDELVFEGDTVIQRHPIDTGVDALLLDGVESPGVAGAGELAAFVAGQETALQECFARHAIRYARLRAETQADGCAVQDTIDVFAQGGTLVDGLVAVLGAEHMLWRSNQ